MASTCIRHFVSFVLVLVDYFVLISGHAALIRPTARGMMWIKGTNSPTNYNYMGLNCGGLKTIRKYNGQCGLCGDPYNGPRDHELGGKYITSAISRTYGRGQKVMEAKLLVNSFNKGHFEFRLCKAGPERLTQECFDQNRLKIKQGRKQGDEDIFRLNRAGLITLQLEIPENLSCKRCVLQWKYISGNNWGREKNGKACMGCGHQETFINCADISIKGWTSIQHPKPTEVYTNSSSVMDFQSSDTSSQDDSSSNFDTQTAIPPPPPEQQLNNSFNHDDHKPRIPPPPPVEYFLDKPDQDNSVTTPATPHEHQHNRSAKPVEDSAKIRIQTLVKKSILGSSDLASEYNHVTEAPFFDSGLNLETKNSSKNNNFLTYSPFKDIQRASSQFSVLSLQPNEHIHETASKGKSFVEQKVVSDSLKGQNNQKAVRFSDLPFAQVSSTNKAHTKVKDKAPPSFPLEEEMKYQTPPQSQSAAAPELEKQSPANPKQSSVMYPPETEKSKRFTDKFYLNSKQTTNTPTTLSPTTYHETFTFQNKQLMNKDEPLRQNSRKTFEARVGNLQEKSLNIDKNTSQVEKFPSWPYMSNSAKLSASDHAALFREMSFMDTFMKPSQSLYPPSKLEIKLTDVKSADTPTKESQNYNSMELSSTELLDNKQNKLTAVNKHDGHIRETSGRQNIEFQSAVKSTSSNTNKSSLTPKGSKSKPPVLAPSEIQDGKSVNRKQNMYQNGKTKQQSAGLHKNVPQTIKTTDNVHSQINLLNDTFDLGISKQDETRRSHLHSLHNIPHDVHSESKIIISNSHQKIHEIVSGWGTPLTTSDVLTKSGTINKLLKAQEMVNYAHDHVVPEQPDSLVVKPIIDVSKVTILEGDNLKTAAIPETQANTVLAKKVVEAQKMVDYAHDHVQIPDLKGKETSSRSSNVKTQEQNRSNIEKKAIFSKKNKLSSSKLSTVITEAPPDKSLVNLASQAGHESRDAINIQFQPLKADIHSITHGQTNTKLLTDYQATDSGINSTPDNYRRTDKSPNISSELSSQTKMLDKHKVLTKEVSVSQAGLIEPQYPKTQSVTDLSKDPLGPIYKTDGQNKIIQEKTQNQAFQHTPTLKPSHNRPLEDHVFLGQNKNHESIDNGFEKHPLGRTNKVIPSQLDRHTNTDLMHSHVDHASHHGKTSHESVKQQISQNHFHSSSARIHQQELLRNSQSQKNLEHSFNQHKDTGFKEPGHIEPFHQHTISEHNGDHFPNGKVDNGLSKDQASPENIFQDRFLDKNSNDNRSALSDQAHHFQASLDAPMQTSPSQKVISDTKDSKVPKIREKSKIANALVAEHSKGQQTHSSEGIINNGAILTHAHKNPKHVHTHDAREALVHERQGSQETSLKTESLDSRKLIENVPVQSVNEKVQAESRSDPVHASKAASTIHDMPHKASMSPKVSEPLLLDNNKHDVSPGFRTGILKTSHDSINTVSNRPHHMHQNADVKFSFDNKQIGQQADTHSHDSWHTKHIKSNVRPVASQIPGKPELHIHDHLHGPKEQSLNIHSSVNNTPQNDNNLSETNMGTLSSDIPADRLNHDNHLQTHDQHDTSHKHTEMPHEHLHADPVHDTAVHSHPHPLELKKSKDNFNPIHDSGNHPQSALAKLRRQNKTNNNFEHHRDHNLHNIFAQIGPVGHIGHAHHGLTNEHDPLHLLHDQNSISRDQVQTLSDNSEVHTINLLKEGTHASHHDPHDHPHMPQRHDLNSFNTNKNSNSMDTSFHTHINDHHHNVDPSFHTNINDHHIHGHAFPSHQPRKTNDWASVMKKTTIDDFVNRLTSRMESKINRTVSHGHDTHIKVLPLSKDTIIQVLQAIANGGRGTSTMLSSHITKSRPVEIAHGGILGSSTDHVQPSLMATSNTDKSRLDQLKSPPIKSGVTEAPVTSDSSQTSSRMNKIQGSKMVIDPSGRNMAISDTGTLLDDHEPNMVNNLGSRNTIVPNSNLVRKTADIGQLRPRHPSTDKPDKLLDLTTVVAKISPDKRHGVQSISKSKDLSARSQQGLKTAKTATRGRKRHFEPHSRENIKPPSLISNFQGQQNTEIAKTSPIDRDSQLKPQSDQNMKTTSLVKTTSNSKSSHNKLKERIATLWRKPGAAGTSNLKSRASPGIRDHTRSNGGFGGKPSFQNVKPVSVNPSANSRPRPLHRQGKSNRDNRLPKSMPRSWRGGVTGIRSDVKQSVRTNVRQRPLQSPRQIHSQINNMHQMPVRPLALRGFRALPFSPRQTFMSSMSSRLPNEEIRRIPHHSDARTSPITGRQISRQVRPANPELRETQISNQGILGRRHQTLPRSSAANTHSRFRSNPSRTFRRIGSSIRDETRAPFRRRVSSNRFIDSNPPPRRRLDAIQMINPNPNGRVMFVGSPEGAQRVISNSDLGTGKDALRKMRRIITESETRSAARGDPRRRILVLPLNRKTVKRIFGEIGPRRQR